MRASAEEITRMLDGVRGGSRTAANELMEAVYTDLHGMARHFFSGERPDNTLQPTVLVHEAYLRIFSGNPVDFCDRVHFYAVAARQMRRILIDHGREFRAQKRGGGLKVALDDFQGASSPPEMEEVDELLQKLQRADPEAARVVEMKFFAGMTDDEVAAEIGCSHSGVRRHWNFAKAWLARQMEARIPART